MIESLLSAPTF